MSSSSIIETVVKITPMELEILGKKIVEAFPNGISLASLTEAVVDCMSMVGQIKKMSGANKKRLVIDMIIYLINNTNSGTFETFEPILLGMVPHLIDSLIEVEKGKLKFNPKIKQKLKCLPCF